MSDALPPPSTPPADPPAIVRYEAAASRPRSAREKELCDKASSSDWLYLTALLASDVGSIYLNAYELYSSTSPIVRHMGPALIGLTWGATIGGVYLALPKCSPNFVPASPPEGAVRSSTPLAFSLAILAGATAPIMMGISTTSRGLAGAAYGTWTTEERALRVIISGITGFGGAFLPYLIPPKTWRAARELERIRFGADSAGVFLGYSATF